MSEQYSAARLTFQVFSKTDGSRSSRGQRARGDDLRALRDDCRRSTIDGSRASESSQWRACLAGRSAEPRHIAKILKLREPRMSESCARVRVGSGRDDAAASKLAQANDGHASSTTGPRCGRPACFGYAAKSPAHSNKGSNGPLSRVDLRQPGRFSLRAARQRR